MSDAWYVERFEFKLKTYIEVAIYTLGLFQLQSNIQIINNYYHARVLETL